MDIPSGLNSDTGQPCGTAIYAQGTATFALPKIGHYTYPGAEYTGKLDIIDIGIPPAVVEAVGPKQFLLTAGRTRAKPVICWLLPARPEKPVQVL